MDKRIGNLIIRESDSSNTKSIYYVDENGTEKFLAYSDYIKHDDNGFVILKINNLFHCINIKDCNTNYAKLCTELNCRGNAYIYKLPRESEYSYIVFDKSYDELRYDNCYLIYMNDNVLSRINISIYKKSLYYAYVIDVFEHSEYKYSTLVYKNTFNPVYDDFKFLRDSYDYYIRFLDNYGDLFACVKLTDNKTECLIDKDCNIIAEGALSCTELKNKCLWIKCYDDNYNDDDNYLVRLKSLQLNILLNKDGVIAEDIISCDNTKWNWILVYKYISNNGEDAQRYNILKSDGTFFFDEWALSADCRRGDKYIFKFENGKKITIGELNNINESHNYVPTFGEYILNKNLTKDDIF